MVKHVVTLNVERNAMTLEALDEIMEAFRQYGFPEVVEEPNNPGRVVAIRVTAEADDLWDLRDRIDELGGEFTEWEHCFLDRTYPTGKEFLQ